MGTPHQKKPHRSPPLIVTSSLETLVGPDHRNYSSAIWLSSKVPYREYYDDRDLPIRANATPQKCPNPKVSRLRPPEGEMRNLVVQVNHTHTRRFSTRCACWVRKLRHLPLLVWLHHSNGRPVAATMPVRVLVAHSPPITPCQLYKCITPHQGQHAVPTGLGGWRL